MKEFSYEETLFQPNSDTFHPQVDYSEFPEPELAPETEETASSRYPANWAHKKIAWVDAFKTSSSHYFNGREFISMQVRYIDPESGNPNRWLGGWSYQPGEWAIFDWINRKWLPSRSPNHSAVVNIPASELLFYGFYFSPFDWNAIKDGTPLVLYVQNFHKEGDRLISEGHTPPNNNNKMGIDRRIEFPFPGGKNSHRFPGST